MGQYGKKSASDEDELPDLDDMIESGLPIWAAIELQNEIAANPWMPPERWWSILRAPRPSIH